MSAPESRHTPQDCRQVLQSWKEIAAYLNRGARTVQRWEKTEGLPVHRHMHERQGTVYAFKDELDLWWASRRSRLALEDEPPPTPTGSRTSVHWLVAAALFLTTAAFWWSRSPTSVNAFVAGRSTPLTSAQGWEYAPSFSPDGKHVAYAAQEYQKQGSVLYVQTLGSGAPRPLTDSNAFHLNPIWSPDGESIAFIRFRDGVPPELILKPLNGAPERVIATHTGQRLAMPVLTWSRDPRWILASYATAPGDRPTIHRIDVSTGATQVATTLCDSCAGDSAPALSSDGRTLAFLRYQRNGVRDIYIQSLTPSQIPQGPPRRLTYHNDLLSAPVWIPGTSDLVYAANLELTWTWRRVSSRGGSPTPFDAFANFRPDVVFSPSGRHLVYGNSLTDLNLRLVDLKEGRERDSVASTRMDMNGHLSPDGKEVVFASDRAGNMDIWKAGIDGANPTQLATFPGKSSGTPRWSPDGKEIAFDVTEGSNADIYVMTSDGARVRRITTEPSRDVIPSWSRDGRFLYLGSDRSGDYQIWRVPAQGGPGVQVTRNGGYAAWECPDSDCILVTKFASKEENANGLWRIDPATGAEERILSERVDWSRVAIQGSSVYFITYRAPAGDAWLLRYDLRSGSLQDLRQLDRPASVGLTISQDASRLIYCSVERRGADLMLAELHR